MVTHQEVLTLTFTSTLSDGLKAWSSAAPVSRGTYQLLCVCVVDCFSAYSDLFWEQRYTLIEWGSSMFGEETDLSLAEYPLPEQVETLIDKGKYQNVETKITKVTY